MRIETIRVEGLKRADGSTTKLAPVTYFHGPNGAGKSTVLDAVKLLCRGEHPDAGRGGTPAKRGDDIMALASGDTIEIEASVRTAAGIWTIGRSWRRSRKARGATSGEVSVSETAWVVPPGGRRIDKKSEAEAEIAKLVGPAAGLDLAELLGPKVTDADRRRLLLSAAGSRSTWDPKTVASELARREIAADVPAWKGSPVDPPLADWLQREWEKIAEDVAHAHTELLRAREAAEKIQQGQVEGAGPIVDPVVVQEAQRAVDNAEETSRQVEARASKASTLASTDVQRGEERETTRRRLEAQLTTVRQQLAKASQQSGVSPRVAQLQKLIADAEDELVDGSLPDLRGQVAGYRQAKERALQRIEELQAVEAKVQAGLASLKSAELAAWADVDRAKNRFDVELVKRTNVHRLNLQTAQREAEPAVAVHRLVKQLLEDAEECFEDSAVCPTCLGRITSMRLGELEANAVRMMSFVHRHEAELQEAEVAVRVQLQQELNASLRLAEQASAAVKVNTPSEQNIGPQRQAYQEAREAEARAYARLRQEEDRVARAREELAAATATNAGAELATLQERERALVAEIATIHVPDLPALRRVAEQAEAQAKRERGQAADALAEARNRLASLQSGLTLQREVTRLQAEVDRWEKAWRQLQRVERELGPAGLMGQVLGELLGPLEALVNEGLGDLGLGTFRVRMLDERGRPVCRPGLERGESWTPVETLSDGERASVLPVLLPALATLIGGPWRLLMADALERLDARRRDRFVARVVQLVTEGRIDQAILAGCPDLAPTVEGCTVINVDAARVARAA